MSTQSFRDLVVWQKSRDLAVKIYKITDEFPNSELYGMTSQMRRAAISISSNIAESYRRVHPKDKDRFISIAFGSGSELESQIEIAKILFPNSNYKELENLLVEVMKILNTFLNK